MCQLVNSSATDSPITLKFCSEFERVTLKVLKKFKIKGLKVKVAARRITTTKMC